MVRWLAVLALLVLGSGAWAHDDADMAGMNMGHEAQAIVYGGPAKAAEATRTVAITMADISFTPTLVQVKKGEVVRFVVKNTGQIAHEFSIGDAASQAAHLAMMEKAMESGKEVHHVHATNLVSVDPGKTRELTWRFSDAGTFEYDCNMPGHFEAGMTGKIVVGP